MQKSVGKANNKSVFSWKSEGRKKHVKYNIAMKTQITGPRA